MGRCFWRPDWLYQQLFAYLKMNDDQCRLCFTDLVAFGVARGRACQHCQCCGSVMTVSAFLPDAVTEKALYLTHQNDIYDVRYQQFSAAITQAIMQHHAADQTGLDFGCGTGPVIAHQLRQKGYQIVLYDAIFHKDNNALSQQYDFIYCCEVIEHFHQPAQMFTQLRSLIKPGGKLYCMTLLYQPQLDFQQWHYKNDPTHVLFYPRKSIDYIRQRFDFAQVEVAERLIVWSV